MTLFKYDSLGNFKWQYRIKKLTGATGFGISSDKYGALYIKSSFSNTLATNIGTLTTGSSTVLNNFVAKIDTVLITSLKAETKIVYSLNIFPNPAKSTVYISSNIDDIFNSKVQIFNLDGKVLMTLHFKNEIALDELIQGVYVISLTNCNNLIVRSKFIKTD